MRPRPNDMDNGLLRSARFVKLTKSGRGHALTCRRQATIESLGGDCVCQAVGQEGGAGREGVPPGFEMHADFLAKSPGFGELSAVRGESRMASSPRQSRSTLSGSSTTSRSAASPRCRSGRTRKPVAQRTQREVDASSIGSSPARSSVVRSKSAARCERIGP